MKFSSISLYFSIILLSIIAFFYYPKWNKTGTESTISWDVSGYYWYLPSIFIYKDVKQIAFTSEILQQYRPTPELLQAFKYTNGNYVFKYSGGQALLMLPGFGLGHISAKVLGFPQDGFSPPYQFGIFIWSLIMTFIGLFYLRKILLEYFDDVSVGLSILTICFGTNFLEYGVITNAMTHNYLFTVYTLLIYFTLSFYKDKSYLKAAGIGISVGLLTLTRPTEMISIFIPITYALKWELLEIVNRIQFLIKEYKKLLLAGVFILLIGGLQLLYWKYTANSWLVYSYEDQGFSWLRPHIYNCLFSARAGWLVYTPVMILSLIGFIYLLGKHTVVGSSLFLFSGIFFYVTFAWDIWWYGGSVSQRALVQLYPVLAFPLTAFYQSISKINIKAIGVAFFALLCIYYNLWMTHHCHKGGMFYAGDMTKPYLKAIFLGNSLPDEALKLLDTKHIFKKPISDAKYLLNPKDSSALVGSICLTDSIQFSPAQKYSLPDSTGWLRASADFYTEDKEYDPWRMTQLVLKFYKHGAEIGSNILRVQRHIDHHEKKNLWLDAKLDKYPDEVEIFLWNADSRKKTCAENIQLIYHTGK